MAVLIEEGFVQVEEPPMVMQTFLLREKLNLLVSMRKMSIYISIMTLTIGIKALMGKKLLIFITADLPTRAMGLAI